MNTEVKVKVVSKMKKLIIGCIIALSFSACSTTYGAGKVIYKGAKTAYIELEFENENVESIDNVLVVYDEVRTSSQTHD
jgi:predicted small secreted protein